MVQIAAGQPLFRDSTFDVLGPRVDLRGTSVNVNGVPVKTTVLKDTTRSNTVGPDVSTPGQSAFLKIGRSNPGQVGIGSDTLFEIKNGLERLDSGELPPTERSPSHALNTQTVTETKYAVIAPFKLTKFTSNFGINESKSLAQQNQFKSTGTETEDTGQTPVRVDMGFHTIDQIQHAANAGTLTKTVAGFIPTSQILPNFAVDSPYMSGGRIDLLA